MRIRNTLKNSAYAVGSYLLIAALSVLVRKLFLKYFTVELLGYEGLFGNIFSLLALTELGIETVVSYRLFPAFAHNDEQEINRIMAVYRYLYRMIGLVVLGVGILLVPFLRLIIQDNHYDWNYLYFIYFFQLIISVATYFLAYKRLMFIVSQKEYECTKIDTLMSLIFTGLKLVTLLLFRSYIVYLLCSLGSNLIGNYLISRKVDKAYPYLEKEKKITRADIRALDLGKDIKNNFFQKVCGTIYGGTDNILISALLGIGQVGLLANYTMISGYVTALLQKILRPFQVSIGNYIYTNDRRQGYRMFRMFDLISFFLAAVVTSCYACLFNPVIGMVFGEAYLLDDRYVYAFCINQYIMWNHQFLTFYRYSFGRYELDKYPILFAAVANIVFSILLSKPFGIAGIMLGTAIGHLGFWAGRVRVVYTEYVDEGVGRYIVRQLIRLALCIGEVVLTLFVCRNFSVSIWGMALRLIVAAMVPVLLNCAVHWKTLEWQEIRTYAKEVGALLAGKRKESRSS